MEESQLIIVIVAIVGVLLGLWIILSLLGFILTGAIVLLAFASEQGFVGLAVYIACWVFLMPIMVIVCAVIGFFAWIMERKID